MGIYSHIWDAVVRKVRHALGGIEEFVTVKIQKFLLFGKF